MNPVVCDGQAVPLSSKTSTVLPIVRSNTNFVGDRGKQNQVKREIFITPFIVILYMDMSLTVIQIAMTTADNTFVYSHDFSLTLHTFVAFMISYYTRTSEEYHEIQLPRVEDQVNCFSCSSHIVVFSVFYDLRCDCSFC